VNDWDDIRTGGGRGFAIAAAALAVLALAISAFGFLTMASDRAALRAEVDRMSRRVETLDSRNEQFTNRLGTAEQRLKQREAGSAGLAKRVLKSVFTVQTDRGLGTGFVAWMDEQSTYVLTAHHVVEGTLSGTVSLERKGGGWQGEIAALDKRNDLALIRMNARPKGIEPLWQSPYRRPPRPGDELVLIGSPFGLGGSVTKGIVSRVTKRDIQTDAAANPGNSGGPAIDSRGRVVGILVAGGGQNVNFAVPVARVCIKLRHC
jgi:serine protease Do